MSKLFSKLASKTPGSAFGTRYGHPGSRPLTGRDPNMAGSNTSGNLVNTKEPRNRRPRGRRGSGRLGGGGSNL